MAEMMKEIVVDVKIGPVLALINDVLKLAHDATVLPSGAGYKSRRDLMAKAADLHQRVLDMMAATLPKQGDSYSSAAPVPEAVFKAAESRKRFHISKGFIDQTSPEFTDLSIERTPEVAAILIDGPCEFTQCAGSTHSIDPFVSREPPSLGMEVTIEPICEPKPRRKGKWEFLGAP